MIAKGVGVIFIAITCKLIGVMFLASGKGWYVKEKIFAAFC